MLTVRERPLQHPQEATVGLNNLIHTVFTAPQGRAFYLRILLIVLKTLLYMELKFPPLKCLPVNPLMLSGVRQETY